MDDKRQAERVKYGLPRFLPRHTLASPTEILLVPHASCPPSPLRVLAARVRIDADGSLLLHYRASGALNEVCWPARCAAGTLRKPTDGLWQHTCFEAFIAEADGTAYREFNFSPAGEWANYRFTDYRERDDRFIPPAAPSIEQTREGTDCTVVVRIPARCLPAGQTLTIGLTAVIETLVGEKSYWALNHLAARPDFHPRASFTLLLNNVPT